MSVFNKFSGKGQGEIYHVFVSKEKITPLLKEKILSTLKVTAIEEVENGSKHFDNKKEAVFTTPLLKENYFQLRRLHQVSRFTKILINWMIKKRQLSRRYCQRKKY